MNGSESSLDHRGDERVEQAEHRRDDPQVDQLVAGVHGRTTDADTGEDPGSDRQRAGVDEDHSECLDHAFQPDRSPAVVGSRAAAGWSSPGAITGLTDCWHAGAGGG
jgi:hypothetical protein